MKIFQFLLVLYLSVYFSKQHMVEVTISKEVREDFNTVQSPDAKITRCLIMKIDFKSFEVVTDKILQNINIDELRTELPTDEPRYVVYTGPFQHKDGRTSYPLSFIYIAQGSKIHKLMLYGWAKSYVIKELGMKKVFTLRRLQELTQEWYDKEIESKH